MGIYWYALLAVVALCAIGLLIWNAFYRQNCQKALSGRKQESQKALPPQGANSQQKTIIYLLLALALVTLAGAIILILARRKEN